MFCCLRPKDGIQYDKKTVAKLLNDSMSISNLFVGSETQSITLKNGLNWEFAWELPVDELLYLEVKLEISRNKRSYAQDTETQLKNKIINNIKTRCLLGQDFEPDSILQIDLDIPYASLVNIGWKTDPDEPLYSYEVKRNDYRIREYVTMESITVGVDNW
jgi:hypothetical protein